MITAARRAAVLGVLLGACGWATAQAPQPQLNVVVPTGERVAWRGIPVDEAAGSQGTMLYPAPNALGLLAAILTHAAIVQGGRESERKGRQQVADQVLEPYAAAIADATPMRLLETSLRKLEFSGGKRLIDKASMAEAGWVAEMQPMFALAPDQRTIVLDNVIKLYPVASESQLLFGNIVRVVATPLAQPDPANPGSADGRALIEEAAEMLAHSITIVLRHVAAASGGPEIARTQRYQFGATEKMERGVLVATGCHRIVLRTLRDSLMSVPVEAAADAPPCPRRYWLATQ